jgi:hypothetical protein
MLGGLLIKHGGLGIMRSKLGNTSAAVLVAILFALTLPPGAQAAEDHWTFGIGTGVRGLNLDGDVGVGTGLGPIDLELDLKTSDVSDFIETAFGLGGFASKGRWTILAGGAYLELAGGNNGKAAGGTNVESDVSFKVITGEIATVYRFAVTGKHAWGVLGGVNYTKHDFEADLTVGATDVERGFDHDWTDAVVGMTHHWQFADKWSWANRIDVGFGGSDGTGHLRTGVGWQAAKWFNLGLYAEAKKVDYENGDDSDSDWYKYDVTESGLGVAFGFVF